MCLRGAKPPIFLRFFFGSRLSALAGLGYSGGGARKKVPIWHARGGHEKNVKLGDACFCTENVVGVGYDAFTTSTTYFDPMGGGVVKILMRGFMTS